MAKRGIALGAMALLLGVAVAGCSRSDDNPPPPDNVVKAKVPAATPAPTSSPTSATPSPTPTTLTNASAAAPKEAPRAPDAQMMDDASATGMTSRSARDEQPADDTAADQAENQ